MGISMMYQALPDQTTLFERLRSDRKICTLFTKLYPYGNGIFYMGELNEEGLDEILDWIAEEQPFSSRMEVDRVMHELRTELERTKALHPGVAERTGYLEKTQDRIQEQLSQELKRKELDAALVLMEQLLNGSEALASEFFDEHDDQLYLVPSKIVKEGAEVLREIESTNLFGGEGNSEQHYWEDFERWKAFYLEASDNEEAVLVCAF
jgi:hypothetical protein